MRHSSAADGAAILRFWPFVVAAAMTAYVIFLLALVAADVARTNALMEAF